MTGPSMKSHLFNIDSRTLNAAMIVAHPDDETLWAGGLLLTRPDWIWTIAALCRGDDLDRAPKFTRVLEMFGSKGNIGAMDDGPDQIPLSPTVVQDTIMRLLDERTYDIILTHSPFGEYTRHRRHEETGRSVASLWEAGSLTADELWCFAYNDDGASHMPTAIDRAHLALDLDAKTWQSKYDTIVTLYGFAPDSWEANATPKREAFWCFQNVREYQTWFAEEGKRL
jgi:LmbE family N-acetylglucosaminyl deacetylase